MPEKFSKQQGRYKHYIINLDIIPFRHKYIKAYYVYSST